MEIYLESDVAITGELKMRNRFLISVTDDEVAQIQVIKNACDKFGISFSGLMVRGTIKEFENGGWTELVKKQEEKE